MSLLTLPTWPSAASKVLARKQGWIGVDIGSTATKLAQVERVGNTWQMAARWHLPHDSAFVPTEESFLSGIFGNSVSSLRQTHGLFRGRKCAFSLPLPLTHLRSFEMPRSNRAELRCMIREELAAELEANPDDLTFDFWEMPEQTTQTADLVRVTAVATSVRVSSRACEDLLSARLEPQRLDSLPSALARALELAAPDASEVPLAALDLGHSSALFVVAKGGRPVFYRALRDCGLELFLQQLQEGLGLSRDESQHLLSVVGLSSAVGSASTSVSSGLLQLVATPLSNFFAELERTWVYLLQQYPTLRPQKLLLLGGGATIRHLADCISERLDLDTQVWSLRPQESQHDSSEAVFGVAAALSASAWENESCI